MAKKKRGPHPNQKKTSPDTSDVKTVPPNYAMGARIDSVLVPIYCYINPILIVLILWYVTLSEAPLPMVPAVGVLLALSPWWTIESLFIGVSLIVTALLTHNLLLIVGICSVLVLFYALDQVTLKGKALASIRKLYLRR